MSERKGFTLIELLVVIAIIALLMAVLMPALQRVKRQARSVACLSKLKQWSLYFAMYAEDHDGRFMAGHKAQPQNRWVSAMGITTSGMTNLPVVRTRRNPGSMSMASIQEPRGRMSV